MNKLTLPFLRLITLQSIRKRTLFYVMSILTGMSLLISVAGFVSAVDEIEELFDASLAQQARSLQFLVLGMNNNAFSVENSRLLLQQEQALNVNSAGHDYESKLYFQIGRNNEVWFGSEDSSLHLFEETEHGFGQAELNGFNWRTFSLPLILEHETITILVAEREDIRGELVNKIVLQTAIPELFGLPLLAFLVWIAVGKGLQPLHNLAADISNRHPNSLESIHIEPLPKELAPIQASLNQLLNQIEQMITREQRFIADAAHELRTPLAVMKIHAENALSLDRPEERQKALKQLMMGVDRSTRIVAQLLTLARLENKTVENTYQDSHVLKETRQLLAELMPLAWTKTVDIMLFCPQEETEKWIYPMLPGHLDTLLQNLVSNAIKFSTAQSEIEVHLQQTDAEFILTVVDHGCGVDAATKQRLVERFYRKGIESGAGLGLSIVQKVSLLYLGSVAFEDTPAGGLTVIVSLRKNIKKYHD